MTVCAAPVPSPQAHKIPASGRSISVDVTVDWGSGDARETYAKTLRFCSFRCLVLWAEEQAGKHDDRTVPKEK